MMKALMNGKEQLNNKMEVGGPLGFNGWTKDQERKSPQENNLEANNIHL